MQVVVNMHTGCDQHWYRLRSTWVQVVVNMCTHFRSIRVQFVVNIGTGSGQKGTVYGKHVYRL